MTVHVKYPWNSFLTTFCEIFSFDQKDHGTHFSFLCPDRVLFRPDIVLFRPDVFTCLLRDGVFVLLRGFCKVALRCDSGVILRMDSRGGRGCMALMRYEHGVKHDESSAMRCLCEGVTHFGFDDIDFHFIANATHSRCVPAPSFTWENANDFTCMYLQKHTYYRTTRA